VLALVRLARRRLFFNELFAQGANASSAALFAFILLLLLGTEILAWEIALLLPVAAACIGFYIARRRRPTLYAAAQTIDRRLDLSDAISTALYFSEPANTAKVTPGIVAAQAAAAESIARTVDVRRAAPYSMPRTAYAMAALLLVAGSLFGLRYGVSHRLDLKQPLASMLYQTFGSDPVKQAANKQHKLPKPQLSPDGEMASAEERLERASEAMEGVNEIVEEMPEGALGKAESKNSDGKKSAESGEKSAGDQQGESSDAESGDDNANSGQQSDKQDGKEGNSKQDSGNSNDNSLLSKMKDAVQNILSKMKPQQNQSGQQQSGEQQGKQEGKGQQGAKQQQAKNGQQQQGGEQQADGQDGQAGEQSQNAQDQQGKGTGNSDSKQASKQPGSGVGSQDGDKQLKNAEQLAAMGKISEIIGKRSQTISGETTVEVQNTQQQLRTQYANRAVTHTQAGAEIGRDEIPVALQSYVESYFEAVRKSATPAAPKK